MIKTVTRSRVIFVWFAAIALVVAASLASGVEMTIGTGGLLLALSLVPPAIVLVLWPREEPMTAAEVLRGADRGA